MPHPPRHHRAALIVAGSYALLAALWILLSDQALAALALQSEASQTAKGWAFVALSAGVLYATLARMLASRERLEATLRHQLERLRSLAAALPYLIFRVRRDGVILERLQTAGPPPAVPDIIAIGKNVREILPPDIGVLLGTVVDQVATARVQQTLRYGLNLEGQLRDYEALLAPYGADEVLALITDRSHERQREDSLTLASLAFEHALAGVVISDADGRILAVNGAFEAITGYSRDEAVGQRTALLKSGRHDQAFYQRMWTALSGDGTWSGEIWNRRKSGEVYPEQLTIRAIPRMAGQTAAYIATFQDLSLVKATQSALERLAHEDPVTRLPNRAYVTTVLDRAVRSALPAGGEPDDAFARAQRLSAAAHETPAPRRLRITAWPLSGDGAEADAAPPLHPGCALTLDLVDFGKINDVFGFHVGDVVLQEVAMRLVAACRAADLIGRIGADEFLVVRAAPTTDDDAARLAAALLTAVERPFEVESATLRLRATIGGAIFGVDGVTGAEVLANAEAARREAARGHERRPIFYRRQMTAAIHQELTIDAALDRAIEQGELRLHLQPFVTGPERRAQGVEALVRWQRGDGALVPPDRFIGRAEQTGAIHKLGAWVLMRACLDASALRAAGVPLEIIAVNVSPVQFRSRGLLDDVLAALGASGLDPKHLELEITESALMDDVDASAAQLDRLVALGIGVAVDDFGTGYSSLATLQRFPVSKLKIDRAFVTGLPAESKSTAICRAVIDLADAFGMTVQAEGVETAAQDEALVGMGCHASQGYLYARPMPAADLQAWWQARHPLRLG